MSRLLCSVLAVGLVSAAPGCSRSKAGDAAPAGSSAGGAPGPAPSPSASPTPSSSAAPEPERGATQPDAKRYAWLRDASPEQPGATDTLLARFETPPGYRRVGLPRGSFGEWLRELPLAAPKTPVTTHKGELVHDGDDQYVAAVVAIDTGKIDLQQSPDVVIRLHAEWLWSAGNPRISYRSATGLDLPLSRWARGERLQAQGASMYWVVKGKPAEVDHASFREYLDAVFTWVNSVSLAQQAEAVEAKDILPGDFFIHSGSPGHALVVLDLARKDNGQQVALLGQALNPTQNVFVLQPGRATAWFSLRPGEPVITPFTKEFTWDGLKRLPAPKPE